MWDGRTNIQTDVRTWLKLNAPDAQTGHKNQRTGPFKRTSCPGMAL